MANCASEQVALFIGDIMEVVIQTQKSMLQAFNLLFATQVIWVRLSRGTTVGMNMFLILPVKAFTAVLVKVDYKVCQFHNDRRAEESAGRNSEANSPRAFGAIGMQANLPLRDSILLLQQGTLGSVEAIVDGSFAFLSTILAGYLHCRTKVKEEMVLDQLSSYTQRGGCNCRRGRALTHYEA